IVKQLWAYIRKNNLQDPSNKRKIICNDALRLVFETDCTDMFKMNKLLAKHILPLDPAKDSGPDPKRLKASYVGSLAQGPAVGSSPVIISEALCKFFGTGEREMPHTEAIERIWNYIQMHHLQHMVAKFLAGLSPDFAVAKAQMLTEAEIPDLVEACNRLSRLAMTLSSSSTDAPSSLLAVPGGRGHSLAILGSRGQAFSRGRGGHSSGGGRGRFQCTFYGRLGHLEDRCWKHGCPMIQGSESSKIKSLSHIPKASHVEDDHTESNAEKSHRSWRRAFFVDRSPWKLSSLNAVEVSAFVFRLQPIRAAASRSVPPQDPCRCLGIRAVA
ncbi:Upstream activation factor subunit, partial [Nymphaea thermarum]